MLPVLLVGCGGPTPANNDADQAVDGETGDPVVDISANTHLNPNPPTYESVPLPEGLVWETNDTDPVFTSPDAKRGGVFTDFWSGFPA